MHGQISKALMQVSADGGDSDAIDLRQLQDFFWRRWKVIVATAIVAMALAFLALLIVTPRFTATAQILLEPRKEKIFGAEQILPELNLETSNVDSQVSVIQSINLLRRVVEKEKLMQDKEFGQSQKLGLFGFLTGLFSSSEPAGKVESQAGEIPPDVLASIKRLREALDVQRVNRTFVLSVSITSEDPAKAVRLTNAVADAFVVDRLDARYDAAKRASSWLAERMESLRETLRQSEEAVADFRKEHNLVATNADAKVTISEQQLSELSGKLIAARAETAEKRAKYEQVAQVMQKGGNLQAIPDVVRSTVIAELRKQQAEVARKEADLIARYDVQHPSLINTRAEKRDIERSIAAEVQRILVNLKNDFDVAKSREDSLDVSLKQITGETGIDGGVGVRLRELERINAANKTLFENFLSRAKITQEQSTFEENEARVISPATKPNAPSFPKKGLVLALAGIVGLLIGIGGAVALDMLNSGFLSSREIEEKLGAPVLASLPLLSTKDREVDGKVLEPARYVVAKPLSRYAESIRNIRVGIQMADVDSPAKVILVTSSFPSEGKSTLAQSLAWSAVKAGMRVMVIDGDLRHPSISKHFGAEAKPGLVDFLTNAVPLEQAVIRLDELAVLPAGSKSQNPPDLLGSERMRQLIEKLRDLFDYIVIDSPPVGPVIDAKVLASLADKVVFSVRWRATPRETVAEHVQYFIQQHKLAGAALSLVDETQAPRYGAYSQYYGHYYKKYYQN
ncbi:exopolysaccharide transport family protein [Methylosinus sp. sav-2]|uniref:polysaccharide biosynthesis tyrosine autokinase n=1 Tax=Methylosinus sp. sav-2 TaxID=2485168 RepID=UPI00047BAF12|nr:polysaccharide biosynthesis tyrosine autokinase [Methylosinus sp. sav-2]TDX62135.1 exopolysaccharide transport family protein [Methylosinus sp. sav-2]